MFQINLSLDLIIGADFECKRQASRFHVKGTFKAFLASNIQSLNELVRLNVHRDPIVNLRVSIYIIRSFSWFLSSELRN